MASTPFEARKINKIRSAMLWLQAAMHDEPQPAATIIAAAAAAGIKRSTLQTAKERLHIEVARQGDGWVWLPPQQPVNV